MNTEQIRADFEVFARPRNYDLDGVMLLSKPPKFSHYVDQATQAAFEAYQAGRAALQSQDAERLQAAARDIFVRAWEIEKLYGINKETEGLVNAAIWLTYLVGPSEQSINHARRIEVES